MFPLCCLRRIRTRPYGSCGQIPASRLLAYTKILQESLLRIPHAANRRIEAELCVVRLCELTADDYDTLSGRGAALEEKLARPGSDVALDDQLYQEPQAAPVAVPMGKFAMYPDWQPDADFIRLAALWGVALREPVTTEELASFIAYWQAEGKVFHHVQWQQKLARSLQIGRASNGGLPKRDVNTVSEPDSQIPPGFRG